MIMTYKEAVEKFKDIEKPSLDEFIKFAKTNFVFLDVTFGAGFILQAIQIAEDLRKAQEK